MSETEKSKQPIKLTREELYHLVWVTPLIHLGKAYGITGNGLAKICHRLDVPYPPQGHWMRIARGKETIRIPLPEVDEATPLDVIIEATPPARSRVSPELKATLDQLHAADGINVPSRLTKPHPVIATWLADRNRQVEETRLERDPWRKKAFGATPFSPLEQRRHRILDTIFKQLERQGAVISEKQDRTLQAEILEEKIEIQLREKLKQVRRPLTTEESRWEWNRRRGYVQELQPTGRLVFAIKTYLGKGHRTEWLETAAAPLEGMLADVVGGILTAAPFLAERTRVRAEERRRYEAEEERRQERKQKQQRDRNRLRRFIEFAEQWRDIELALDFLGALRAAPLDPAHRVGERTVPQWLDWLGERLQEANPIAQGAAAILGDIDDVEAWTYHD